jgi:SAM-dependent methyltransferase
MPLQLYSTLAPWYRLVDPLADHLDEAAALAEIFTRAVAGPRDTLLELGAGAGNNAFYLKRGVRCTLTDLSPEMLALSRGLNPDCEHVPGDMRRLRLDRAFDMVLVHDAVTYLTTEADLLACAHTAFAHTRAGGAAIFAPDFVGDTVPEATEIFEGRDGPRALRGVAWTWDPRPDDGTYSVDYAFLLRDGATVSAVHDAHLEGLFPEAAWHRVLAAAGFDVETVSRAIPPGHGETEHIFVCRRPRTPG